MKEESLTAPLELTCLALNIQDKRGKTLSYQLNYVRFTKQSKINTSKQNINTYIKETYERAWVLILPVQDPWVSALGGNMITVLSTERVGEL